MQTYNLILNIRNYFIPQEATRHSILKLLHSISFSLQKAKQHLIPAKAMHFPKSYATSQSPRNVSSFSFYKKILSISFPQKATQHLMPQKLYTQHLIPPKATQHLIPRLITVIQI